MTARIKESGALRQLSHKYIDNIISVRRSYLLSSKSFFRNRLQDITDDTVENLHKFCQFLLDTPHKFKLVVEFSTIRLYAESEELFQQLLASDVIMTGVRHSQVDISRPRDTVLLKNPVHTHRSYFKRAKTTEAEKRAITQLLLNNAETLRASPALKYWTTQTDAWYQWISPHYFVDHSDESCLILLSLIRPHMIKKTIPIIKS